MSEIDKLAAQAARKRLLIAQGEMYRVGIVHARAYMTSAMASSTNTTVMIARIFQPRLSQARKTISTLP